MLAGEGGSKLFLPMLAGEVVLRICGDCALGVLKTNEKILVLTETN